MSDAASGNLYQPLDDLLNEYNAVVSVPELHGLLIGSLCAHQSSEQWLQLAQESLDIPGEFPEVLQVTANELFQLYQKQLSARDYQFQPLLPPMEVELSLLVRSVSDWVTGFLAGLAAVDWSDLKMGEDSKELLQDLAAISQVVNDDQDGAGELQDLVEILEYVRVAVFNLYEDIAQFNADAKPVIH